MDAENRAYQRNATRRWREKHKNDPKPVLTEAELFAKRKKHNEYMCRWRVANPDKIKADNSSQRRREWAANRRVSRVSSGLCGNCGNDNPYSNVWKNCLACQIKIRAYFKNLKLKAIEYLGGECQNCGLKSEYSEVYDFHHRDATKKDFSISKSKVTNWEKAKLELDKCDLLCANCHRIRHSKKFNTRSTLDYLLKR